MFVYSRTQAFIQNLGKTETTYYHLGPTITNCFQHQMHSWVIGDILTRVVALQSAADDMQTVTPMGPLSPLLMAKACIE